MSRAATRMQAWLERHLGVAGVAGAALLAACAAFFYAGLLPAQAQRDRLHAQIADTGAARGQGGGEGAQFADEALVGFYGNLATRHEASAALRALFDAAAAESLSLERGEYRVVRDPSSRLVRYQIVLPVHGSYVAIRRFVVRAVNEVPGLALEQLDLRRETAASRTIDARVQLTLFLAGA